MSTSNLSSMSPIAEILVARGHAVWNLEYRRIGDGGGWPATYLDVAAGVDHLGRLGSTMPTVAGLLDRIVLVGVSAGAQLAVWAASRTDETPGGSPTVDPRGVVSLAGPLLMTQAATTDTLLGAFVRKFLGGTPDQVPDRYRLGDPGQLLPARAPVRAVQGGGDVIVPPATAAGYVRADVARGGTAEFVPVEATHTTIARVNAPSWPTVLGQIEQLSV